MRSGSAAFVLLMIFNEKQASVETEIEWLIFWKSPMQLRYFNTSHFLHQRKRVSEQRTGRMKKGDFFFQANYDILQIQDADTVSLFNQISPKAIQVSKTRAPSCVSSGNIYKKITKCFFYFMLIHSWTTPQNSCMSGQM